MISGDRHQCSYHYFFLSHLSRILLHTQKLSSGTVLQYCKQPSNILATLSFLMVKAVFH